MRALLAIVLVLLLSGCVRTTPSGPDVEGSPPATDGSAVVAVPDKTRWTAHEAVTMLQARHPDAEPLFLAAELNADGTADFWRMGWRNGTAHLSDLHGNGSDSIHPPSWTTYTETTWEEQDWGACNAAPLDLDAAAPSEDLPAGEAWLIGTDHGTFWVFNDTRHQAFDLSAMPVPPLSYQGALSRLQDVPDVGAVIAAASTERMGFVSTYFPDVQTCTWLQGGDRSLRDGRAPAWLFVTRSAAGTTQYLVDAERIQAFDKPGPEGEWTPTGIASGILDSDEAVRRVQEQQPVSRGRLDVSIWDDGADARWQVSYQDVRRLGSAFYSSWSFSVGAWNGTVQEEHYAVA